MPDTWSGITYNQDGVCSLCTAYDSYKSLDWNLRERQLWKLLDYHKTRHRGKYNCLVGFSGGKDTSYTMALLVKKFGMIPLAFTFDHGFPLSPEGEFNINEFPKILGVDHVRFTLGNDLRNAMAKQGCKRIGDFCLGCHLGIGAMPAHVARMFGIELSVWGEPTALYSTTGNYQIGDMEEQDEEHFKDAFYGNLPDVVPPGFREEDLWMMRWPQGKFPYQAIYLGNYVDWSSQRANVEVIKSLGWREPKDPPSNSWCAWDKADCLYEEQRDWQKFLKRGFGKASFQASKDIREGLITREEGLRLIDQYEGKEPSTRQMNGFLKDTGLSEGEFRGS